MGRALDEAIRRETACGGVFSVEHEVLADVENRLTLSDNKDVLGLNKPAIRYDVGDYVRKVAEPICILFPLRRNWLKPTR